MVCAAEHWDPEECGDSRLHTSVLDTKPEVPSKTPKADGHVLHM